MILKDGSVTADPRLDRVVQFDMRSRAFPIRALITATKPRSYSWRIAATLDQGQSGACVGFGWTHELIARPVEVAFPDGNAYAHDVYWDAQRLDDMPGGSYPGALPQYEGTSVLAGAKAVVARGWMSEYRWAFGIDDVVMALAYSGPVVLGLNWYRDMFTPDASGRIKPTGAVVGGHCIVAHRVALANSTTRSDTQIWLHNSWGPSWGQNGDAYITANDLATLLAQSGEACVPTVRLRPAGF